jgi:hypothetical protein
MYRPWDRDLPDDIIWVEDPIWYDGICYYQDSKWNKYSTRAHILIDKDELCRYWYIYKVEEVKDWDWPYNYHYKILSKRVDE